MRKIFFSITLFLIATGGFAQDYYWVNGSGNWSDVANHWATTSGGSIMHTQLPGPNNNVVFDANSFTAASQTVTIDITVAQCRNIDFTSVTNNPTITSGLSDTLRIYRSLIFNAAMTNTIPGIIHFASSFTCSVNSAGHSFLNDCIFEGIGTWNLQNAFICDENIYLNEGAIVTNGNLIRANAFFSTPFSVRSLNLGTSIVEITGKDTAWEIEALNFFLTAGTSEIRFIHNTNAKVYALAGGTGLTYRNIAVNCANFSMAEGSTGNSISAVPGAFVSFYAEAPHNWNIFNFTGTCNAYITVNSMIPDSTVEFNSTGIQNCSYIIISDINGVTGTYNASNSINEGNVTNWTITNPPTAGYVFWIGNTGNWSNPANWSTGCLPGPLDTVVFNAGSFSAASDTVYLDINGYAFDMRWQGVTGNPVFTGSQYDVFIRRSVVLDPNMVYNLTGELEFVGTANGNIRTNGVVLNGNVRINTTGTRSLFDALTSNADIILENGTFSSNNQNIAVQHFNTDFTTTRILNLTSSQWNMNGFGETFIVNATNLTLNAATSVIHFNTTSANTAYFIGAFQTYNQLRLHNKSTLMGGGNTFSLLEIDAGKELILENLATQTVDSLRANGTCVAPISISAYTMAAGPANILKTGYDTLIVSNVHFNHVTADNTAPNLNLNQQGTLVNTTTGWTTTATGAGTNFYWRGGNGVWSDVTEWDSPIPGTPAGCLPGIKDTVRFDNASFTGAGQQVLVDITASCASMNWTGSAGFLPVFTLARDIYVRKDVVLNAGVTVNNINTSALIRFVPVGNNASFNSFEVPFDADVMLDGGTINDTLFLLSDLKMSDNAELYIDNGTFITNNDSIDCGSFIVESTNGKRVRLGTSYIRVHTLADFRGTHTLTAGTSTIYCGWNNAFGNFYGGNKIFRNVILNGSTNGVSDLTGSNTFTTLTLLPGIRCRIQALQTQTIITSFTAVGACPADSIFIYSDVAAQTTSINCAVPATVQVAHVTNINGTGAIMSALFSTNNGGNANWNFLPTQPTVANFTTPFDVCLGNNSVFTNTSTAFSGGMPALTFEWEFGDGNTSTLVNPVHTYITDDVYYVTLTSTFTNGCAITKRDSVRVNDADIIFSSTQPDLTICQGESVTFTANSQGASNYQFFVNGVSVQNGILPSYVTTTLTNNAAVYVRVTLNGCAKNSDTLVFTVHNLPVVTLTSSDTDNIICAGNQVVFYGGGTSQYLFYINAVAQGSFSIVDTLTLTNIINGQTFTLQGKDTVTGCTNFSATALTFTVNPLPVPTMTCSDADLAICQGNAVTFTAGGATQYQFFINGVSQQGPSALNTFNTTALNNGNIVTVQGTSLGCSATSTNTFTFFVFPLPTVGLSVSPSNTICSGQNAQFTASGSSLYQFFVNGVPVQGPSGSTTYSNSTLTNGSVVTVQGSTNGCLGNIPSVNMTVVPLPVVTLTSSDADNSICFGEPVTFTAGGATSYQFFINGVSAQGPSASNVFTTASIQNGQTVSVIGYTSGCAGNGTASYTFNVFPPFTVNFYCFDADFIICAGDNIDFTATGVGVTGYELFVNGVSFATNATGIFSLTTLPVGTQVVSVTGYKNGCSQLSATTFTITVNAIPVTNLLSSDADNIICSGDSVVFTGTGAGLYEFFIDGNSQGGFTTVDTFFTTSLINGQVVTVTGANGTCAAAGLTNHTITVNALPVVTLASSDIDNIICNGTNITFTAGGATSYQFFINGVSVQGPSVINTYSNSSLTNGQVVSVSGSANGCEGNMSSFGIIVNPLPVVTGNISDADTTICQGDAVTTTTTGASLFEFFIDGVSTGPPSVSNNYTTTGLINGQEISFIGTSANGCSSLPSGFFDFTVNPLPTVNVTSSDADGNICINDVVDFTASGATSYTFYVDGQFAANGPLYSTDSLENGQVISATGTSLGCTAPGNATFSFNVYNYPLVNLATSHPSLVICAGDTVDFIGFGGLQFEFFINGISMQGPSAQDTFSVSTISTGETITVDAINNGCATTSAGLTFTVNPYPVTTASSSDPNNEICFGESVTFTANGAAAYSFEVNGLNMSGITPVSTYTTSGLNDGDLVTVTGYNGNCAAQSLAQFPMVVHTMNIDLSSSSNNMICAGDNVVFTATGADQYEFFIDGVSAQGPSAAATFIFTGLTNGQVVSVDGTNFTTNCVQQGQITQLFVVLNAPVVTPAGPIQLCENDSISLIANPSDFISWYNNGVEIPFEHNQTLWVTTSGNYQAATELGGIDEIWSVGKNTEGQLGDSSFISSFQIVEPVVLQNNIIQIEAGQEYGMALTTTGEVFAWGRNDFGQLGDGTFGTSNYPKQIAVANVIDIAAGGKHGLGVNNAGGLYSWGRNVNGQLGLGNTATTNFPFPVPGITNGVACAAGFEHSLVLLSDGSILSFGSNAFGQLGNGTLINSNIPVMVTGIPGVVSIAAGAYHSMAIDSAGNVWVWGNNAEGQLGMSSINFSNSPVQNGLTNATVVSGGQVHSLVVRSNKTLWAFGGNDHGQLGNGTTNGTSLPQLVTALSGVEYAKAGIHISYTRKSDNSVWNFGKNANGEIGNNSTSDVLTPAHISEMTGAKDFGGGLYHTNFLAGAQSTCLSNTVNVTVNPAPAVTVLLQDTLLVASQTGTGYEWFVNGIPIINSNNQSLDPTVNGSYSVTVTYANGCEVTSAAFIVNGINEYGVISFNVYPNPTNGEIHLEVAGCKGKSMIEIVDAAGRVIQSQVYMLHSTGNSITLDFSVYTTGVYMVRLINEEQVIQQRIVKVE